MSDVDRHAVRFDCKACGLNDDRNSRLSWSDPTLLKSDADAADGSKFCSFETRTAAHSDGCLFATIIEMRKVVAGIFDYGTELRCIARGEDKLALDNIAEFRC